MKQVIGFIKKLVNWIFRIFKWATVEFKLLWITLLLPIFVGVIIFRVIPDDILIGSNSCGTLENRFRLTGLILELLGIGLVVYGLNKTLKLFLGKHLLHIIPKLIKRFPKFGNNLPTAKCTINWIEEGETCSMDLTSSPAPNSSIENRVAFLEEQIKKVNLQAHKDRIHYENEIKRLSDALNVERSEREGGDKQSQQALKEFAVEDVYKELMGVIWLFFGAIFATASTELASISCSAFMWLASHQGLIMQLVG